MKETLDSRIAEILSSASAGTLSALPLKVVDALSQFDPDLDQLHLFERWEALEILEVSLRYALSPGLTCWLKGAFVSEAKSQTEDDTLTEAPEENEQADPEGERLGIEGAFALRDWLELITGQNAMYSVHAAEYSKWALSQRQALRVTRWDVALALEEARTHACDETTHLEQEQRSIEHQIIVQNLRAALYWAHRLKGEIQLPLALAAGLEGVRRAARKFEADRGYQFLTLGTWWIRQSIGRIRQDYSLPIRVPVHRLEKLSRLKRAVAGVPQEDVQRLTPAEILNLVNQTEGSEWTLADVEQYVRLDRWQRASNVPWTTDFEPPMDTYFDEFRRVPAEVPPNPEIPGTIASQLDPLVEYIDVAFGDSKWARTKEIVTERLQLHGRSDRLTLEQLGQKHGVSRERIRQVEAKAFERLLFALKRGER